MNIAHIYDEHYRVSPEKGSVAKVIYNLATTQAENDHEVTIIERQWKDLPAEETTNGVRFVRFPLRVGSDIEGEEIPYKQIRSLTGILKLLLDRFEFALKLKSHFRRTDYDVVHFHVPFSANILVHIFPRIRNKLVYTAHVGEEEIRFGLSSAGAVSYLLSVFSPDLHLMKRSRATNVLNKKLESKLPLTGVEVIPNGVDIREYTPDNNSPIDVNSEFGIRNPFVLFVGTITPRKGPDVLLDAVSILEERNAINGFDFVFVGEQGIEEEFTARIINTAASIRADIAFPGFVDLESLKALYAQCDVFVLPSYEEGMPMVVAEALASGAPVVASDVSGIPEQVQDGENGFLIEPGDAEQLADKLELLLGDRELREAMGEKSRQTAVEEFSWDSVCEKYISMYESVLHS